MNREKKFTYVLMAVFAGGFILSSFAEDLVTRSGRCYKNYEIRNVSVRGVNISHDTGAASVPFEDLPEAFILVHPDVEKKLKERDEKKLAAEKARQEEMKQKLAAEKARQEETERERLQNLRKMEEERRQQAEEQAKKELFIKSLFVKDMPDPVTAVRKQGAVGHLPNIVFIEGTGGSGTGFKVKFGRENVIVTNAHVFLELINPQIRDVFGNNYKIERIISSTTRDLVILKYTPVPKESPVLKMASDVASIPTNAPVVAYGNSQGANVNATLPGNFLGVGYDIIEVSAGIVGGNSGGPVVLQSSGEVIGVATFLTIRTITPQMTNTRFAANRGQNYSVRRFATRIDNLKETELEDLTDADLHFERVYLSAMEEVGDNVSRMISRLNRYSSWENREAIRVYLAGVNPAVRKAEAHVWKSTYLSKEFQKKQAFIQMCAKILDANHLILAARLKEIWEKSEIKAISVEGASCPKTCPDCHGTGNVPKAVQRHRSIRDGGGFNKEMEKCSSCNGTGQMTAQQLNSKQEYEIPAESMKSFQECVRTSKRDFNGFTIGGKSVEEIRRFAYYSKENFLRKYVNQLEYVYVFKGNHSIQEAAETRLSFLFGCLLKEEIYIPYSTTAITTYTNYVSSNFSNLEDVYKVDCSVDRNNIVIRCEHEAYGPILQLPFISTSKSGVSL